MTYEAPDKGQRCSYCHGATGISPFDVVPSLAGQKRQYLIDELVKFRDSALDRPLAADHDRFNAMMAPASYDLSDKEIVEFADYYSRQSCKLPR
jgi:cytochrome c553